MRRGRADRARDRTGRLRVGDGARPRDCRRCSTSRRPDAATYHTLLRAGCSAIRAVSLFKRAGLDFEVEKRRAQTKAFTPVPLGDATLSAAFDVERDQVVTRNVIGRLEGAQRPDETVIYSAHWDAFGIGEPDAAGDAVRPRRRRQRHRCRGGDRTGARVRRLPARGRSARCCSWR